MQNLQESIYIHSKCGGKQRLLKRILLFGTENLKNGFLLRRLFQKRRGVKIYTGNQYWMK
jgi:hypothetical protein